MTMLRKNIHWIICTCVLAIIVLCGLPETKVPYPRFCISSNAAAEEITVYEAENGNCYVFLPAYAELENVTVVMSSGQRVYLDGVKLTNGMSCAQFALETAYPFEINGRHQKTLWFYQSANVATVYIDTVTGSMKHIHSNRDIEESATISVYTADGNMDYINESITIKGRGRSSWGREKKPYTIKLPQSSSLLNMGTSAKWVLNSQGYDLTNLHNKLVYDFADSIAPTSAWAPDCENVEVYLNGEYTGLYLLCQKIDTNSDYMDLDTDDYYFELTIPGRTLDSRAAFRICDIRSIDIVFPDKCSDTRVTMLQDYIAHFQEALFSDTGVSQADGTSWMDYIDMDSWARKYLIDEIFSNFDSGKSSQYFRFDASEQKIYAGHCWDYDLTFGSYWRMSWSTPYNMIAQRNWDEDTSWYNALCRKDEFMALVVELYATEFRPLLQEYIDEVVQNAVAEVEDAAVRDQLRLPTRYAQKDWNQAVKDMEEHLRERVAFLDALWLEQADFCTITLQPEGSHFIYVPTGTVCTYLPQPTEIGLRGEWYIAGTDELFDATQPVIKDVTIVAKSAAIDTSNGGIGTDFAMREYIVLASVAMLLILLLGFVCIDLRKRSEERRLENEGSRTEISP